MPKFTAQVMDASGQRSSMQLEADSMDTAQSQLSQQQLFVISLKQQQAVFQFRQKAAFNVVIFVHELKTLLNSGLSVSEALDVLLDHRADNAKSGPVYKIREGLNQGFSLSQAMLACGDEVFPGLLIATVAASERNGTIVAALSSYIRYDEQISSLRSKIYNASMYPMLLVGIAFIVSLFLLMYLVPRFGAIYDGVDMQLPLASKLMLQLGVWIGEYRGLVISGLAIVIALLVKRIWQQGPENTLMFLLSSFRPLKRRLDIVFLSRFYRGLALLLDAGASVTLSFDMAASLLSGRQQQQLQRAKLLILQGQGLSSSLQVAGLTTPVSARLLAAGDQNGEIVAMLKQSAEFHDLDLSQFIEKFSRLLEPVLMLAIGLFIGLIVVLLYMPIFDMASGIQS